MKEQPGGGRLLHLALLMTSLVLVTTLALPPFQVAQSVQAAPLLEHDDEQAGIGREEGNGGRRNIVRLRNRADGRLRVKGNIQLNRISSSSVEPVNVAFALGSCTDCQTIAVALQVDLYQRGAQRVAPQNAAIAINQNCTRCYTVARAIQYVYAVDDLSEVPPEASELIRELDRELNSIHSAQNALTLNEAEQTINAVIWRFSEAAESIRDWRDETHEHTSEEPQPSATHS